MIPNVSPQRRNGATSSRTPIALRLFVFAVTRNVQARLRFGSALLPFLTTFRSAFAAGFLLALTVSRLFLSASIRFTTFAGISTAGATNLFAGDLRVDDVLQPLAVFVAVLVQVELLLERRDDLLGQLHFLGLHFGRESWRALRCFRCRESQRRDAACTSRGPLSCGFTATRYSRP